MTEDQAFEWLKYFEMDLERPDKTEWYIAQLTQVVASIFAKTPPSITSFLMKFLRPSRVPDPPKPGEPPAMSLLEQTKRLWISRVGGKVRVVTKKRSELENELRQ